jgi:uncharacterized protein (DUF1015 family)
LYLNIGFGAQSEGWRLTLSIFISLFPLWAAAEPSLLQFCLPLMALISPFQAWRYDPERVPVQLAVTQPYDKITPAMQERYYHASPYNLVRIILGKRLPGDGEAENVYTRAAASFQNWRQTGVLRQDPEPSIYRYSQTFRIPGDVPGGAAGSQTRAERRGFIALGRIEEYSAGVVFRHEQTLAKPKADRLDLLRANRAHFGQIFMLYNGTGKVDALLDSAAAKNKAPDIEVTDEYDVVHRVWKIPDASVIASVQQQMRDRKLIIADGHHRYETALTYRNERRDDERRGAPGAKTDTRAPYDSVMMTFVDMDRPDKDRSDKDRPDKDRPGLVILPTHRLVFGLPSFSPAQFHSDTRKFFNVEEVDAGIDAARATAILQHAGHAGTALLAVTAGHAFLLHSPKAIGTGLFGNLSLRQQALDVVQLHKCLLEGVLKISEEAIRDQENVSYCRETGEALMQVRSGKVQVAFLMNPVRMEQVRDIAFAGEVLPQKSTDFYPKLLSGLTIYALE